MTFMAWKSDPFGRLGPTSLQEVPTMLRFAILLSAFVAIAPPALRADPVQSVITRQLSAFGADDFDTAFTFASPMIQRLFGTSERFGEMVRNGYPMVHRAQDVTMLDQRRIDGRLVQRLLIRDMAGRAHLLDYEMIETPEGWQINGVRILRAPEAGA